MLPLWLSAGLADWHRHRRTHIETTAGARESMIHSLMMTEAGVPVALGLFCEVNPGVLATCAGALAVHGATAYWDVSYAEERRRVTPLEQHIHSLLEVVPLMATGFLTVLYWDQARALVGQDGRPDFRLRLKRRVPPDPDRAAGRDGRLRRPPLCRGDGPLPARPPHPRTAADRHAGTDPHSVHPRGPGARHRRLTCEGSCLW